MRLSRLAPLAPLALLLALAPAPLAWQDPEEGEGEGEGRGREEEPAERSEEEPPEAAPEELYPPAERETVLRYYILDGEVDEERLDAALLELDDVDTALLYGPEAHRSKPDKNFIAIETGAEVELRDLERALKRSRCKLERLAYVLIDWTPQGLPRGRRNNPSGGPNGSYVQTRVIEMHSAMRWCEGKGEQLALYYVEGKMRPEEVVEQFTDMFRSAAIDESLVNIRVAQDSFAWELTTEEELRDSDYRRIEREIGRMNGVSFVSLDPHTHVLNMTITLAGLDMSGQPGELGGAGAAGGGGGSGSELRPCWYTNPLLELLREHDFALAAPVEEVEAAGDEGARGADSAGAPPQAD